MSEPLLKQRRFLPYFTTLFLGAFNDNLFKYAVIILITYHLVSSDSGLLVNAGAGLFILPFFLFSSVSGQLAAKYEKSAIIQKIKIAEIVIAVAGIFALVTESIPAMLGVLFLFGAQSTFFSPIKYSILPQHLKEKEILTGNAIVESGTQMAILLGTICGGLLASELVYLPFLYVFLLLVAVAGWYASRFIPLAPAANPAQKIDRNLWVGSKELIDSVRKDNAVFKAVLAVCWFYFFGSVVLIQFPAFAKEVLFGDAKVATLLLALFTVGIVIGSWLCAVLSKDHVEVGLMPVGALIMSFFLWHLSSVDIASSDSLRNIGELLGTAGIGWVIFDLIMIAVGAGLFVVPMYAFIQVRSPDEDRAKNFAGLNIIFSVFAVSAALFSMFVLSMGYTVPQLFSVTALLNVVVTIYIISVVPEFFFRLVGSLLIHSIYRIEKVDLENIPKNGPAVLVCNHISFVDPIIISAVSRRPIRYVMINSIYKMPVIHYLFKWLGAIPIASRKENPELVDRAFDKISKALDQGQLVCIFPEGAITRDGELAQFKPGIEHIINRNPVPVVPLAIKGLWGTWFSRFRGRAMKGFPISFGKKLSVVSDVPHPPEEVSKEKLYDAVLRLRGDRK